MGRTENDSPIHKPYVIHYQAEIRIKAARTNAATSGLDAVPAEADVLIKERLARLSSHRMV